MCVKKEMKTLAVDVTEALWGKKKKTTTRGGI